MPQGYEFTREDADRIMDRFTKIFEMGICPHLRLCKSIAECFKKDLNDLGRPCFRDYFLNGGYGHPPDQVLWRIRDGE